MMLRTLPKCLLALFLFLAAVATPASADHNVWSIVYNSDTIPGTVCWEIELVLEDSAPVPNGYLFQVSSGTKSASVAALLQYAAENNAYMTPGAQPRHISSSDAATVSQKLGSFSYDSKYDLDLKDRETPSGKPTFTLAVNPDSLASVSLAVLKSFCAPGFGQATTDSHGATTDDEFSPSVGRSDYTEEGTFTGGAVSANGQYGSYCTRTDDGPWSCLESTTGVIVLYGVITTPVTEFSASVDVQPPCTFFGQPVSADASAPVAIDAYGLDALVIRVHAWFSGSGPGECTAETEVVSF